MPLSFPEKTLERARCSLQERRELLRVVETFQTYVQQARREGSLCLARYQRDYTGPNIHQVGLSCIVGGWKPEDVATVLLNIVQTSDHTGRELLHRILIAEGIHCISEGRTTSETLYFMKSLLGDEIFEFM
jgi:flagellar motor component MotA